MKTLILMTMTLGLLLTACSVEVPPAPIAPPQEKPLPFPATCVDYQGKYQVNAETIEIKQKNCEKIEITWLPTIWDPKTKTITFVPNGLLRDVDGKQVRSFFFQDELWTRMTDEQKHIIDVRYSFQTRPCNLMNPSGEYFLTKETFVDGKLDDGQCKFWSQID